MASDPGVIKKLDEVVVNRIAAGEVIQRPANALKELLENALDAGSTQVNVTVRGGGLKLLQIQDNGTGIRKEDLAIVAERFTTSKLREFGDLKSIATYGFRGEALASISHVAHLTITTKTRNAACGFKCTYKDGKPSQQPSPLAANQGTTITVEDLFYNVTQRRDALRGAGEEFNKIAEVVSRYAIHNSGVGMSLRKAGESGVEVKTVTGNSIVDNIRTIYGPTIAKELVEFSMEDDKLKFSAKGQISNVNYHVKKFVFLLFINNRLVESSALKRAIESVYQPYLPKGTAPFVYLCLSIAPENLDVNVHPTKHEVFFLHQDAVIERVQAKLEEKLLNSNSSRTFYTQKLLPGAGVRLEMFDSKEKTVAAKDMIRTDSNLQKMDKFLKKQGTGKGVGEQEEHEREKVEAMEEGDEDEMEEVSVASTSKKKVVELTSVQDLRQEVANDCSPECRAIIAGHSFVGCVDRKLALVQHSTRLYLVNTTTLTRHLFKQLLLRDFGALGALRLNPPPSVYELALLALDQEEAGWKESDGSKEDLAKHVTITLASHAAMLADYFSLEFEETDEGLMLTGVPRLLEGHCPWWPGLPLYLLRLAIEVDWKSEKGCFSTFINETAEFYCLKDKTGARWDSEQHTGVEVDWRDTVEQMIYPALKSLLLPPRSCLTDSSILQVANLPDLYKVFERC